MSAPTTRAWPLHGRQWLLGLLVVAPLLATGCGGSSHGTCDIAADCGSAAQPPAETDSPSGSATTSATTTTPASQSSTGASFTTVTGTTSDQQGNAATVTIGVGTPEPLERLSSSVATACNEVITSTGQSLSSAMAIPFRVTAEVTSSLKAPVGVNLSEAWYLEPQRHEVELLSNQTNLGEVWATSYSNTGPECPDNAEGAQVTWTAEDITPHTASSWETWLIIAGAITPDDPAGEVAQHLLIRPTAQVGSGIGGDLTPQGPGWVHCSVTQSIVGPQPEAFLAVEPAVAHEQGCSG